MTATGSVVWVVPYESDIDHQHILSRQNNIIHQQTLQDCFQRLIAAYSRINALEGFESQASVSNLHLEKTLAENAELKRRLRLRDVPHTRCFGVQTNTNSDNGGGGGGGGAAAADAATTAATAAAAQAIRYTTSIVHSELTSAMASASQLICKLEHKLELNQLHIAHQDQQIADLLLQLAMQKDHSWRQQRQQEEHHDQRVAALTRRLASSLEAPVALSPVSPSSEAAAEAEAAAAAAKAAALSAAKEEIFSLQSSLAKETGAPRDMSRLMIDPVHTWNVTGLMFVLNATLQVNVEPYSCNWMG